MYAHNTVGSKSWFIGKAGSIAANRRRERHHCSKRMTRCASERFKHSSACFYHVFADYTASESPESRFRGSLRQVTASCFLARARRRTVTFPPSAWRPGIVSHVNLAACQRLPLARTIRFPTSTLSLCLFLSSPALLCQFGFDHV